MDLWTRVKSIFVGEAAQRVYIAIPPDHVSPFKKETLFKPDEAYIRIWVNDMFLNHRRVLYQTRSPLVHAFCRFLYRGEVKELPLVAGSGQIGGLRLAVDRVVNLNYPVVGPVPFQGGEVEIILALVAVEAADYGNQLLDVLGTLSELTGKGELKLGLQLLKPLKRGLEGLFGLDKVKAHLGVHDTFAAGESSPNPLHSGYRVVFDATRDQIDQRQLWVKKGRLCVGSTPQAAQPFEGTDYFMFYIEGIQERDDWSILNSIKGAWDETISKVQSGNNDDINLAFVAFKSVVLESPDLIWSDRARLIDALSKKVQQVLNLSKLHLAAPVQPDTGIEESLFEAMSIMDAKRLDRADILQISWQ